MPNEVSDAIEAQRDVMLAVFRQAGLTRATYLREVSEVARAAAAAGEYGPAAKLYDLLGKGLGILNTERHVHLHGVDQGGMTRASQMAQMTDEQLIALAQEQQALSAEVVSVRSEPVVEAEVVPEGDDPLFR